MAEKRESNVVRLEHAGLQVSRSLPPKVLERINELKSTEVAQLIEISHKIMGQEGAAAATLPGDALVGIQQAHL